MQIRSVITLHCLQLKSGNDIYGNIEAVFLKLGIISVHHKRNNMTSLMLLPWLQSLSAKKLNTPFATSKVRQRVLLETDIVPILSSLPSFDWVG